MPQPICGTQTEHLLAALQQPTQQLAAGDATPAPSRLWEPGSTSSRSLEIPTTFFLPLEPSPGMVQRLLSRLQTAAQRLMCGRLFTDSPSSSTHSPEVTTLPSHRLEVYAPERTKTVLQSLQAEFLKASLAESILIPQAPLRWPLLSLKTPSLLVGPSRYSFLEGLSDVPILPLSKEHGWSGSPEDDVPAGRGPLRYVTWTSNGPIRSRRHLVFSNFC